MTQAEAPPSQSQQQQQQQQQHQEPLELPRNARIVSLIMQAMDVTDYQPAVLPQLMEFVHRYVLDVVADAQLFADHAGRTEIDADDVRLAVEAKMSHSFTGAPSKEVLASIAEAKNVAPLPVVNEKLGLRLPPERNALTGLNFQILPRKPNFEDRLQKAAAAQTAANATLQPPVQPQQQQFQQQQQQQQFMAFGGAPVPQPFMFGGMGAQMNMNLGMGMGIGIGMNANMGMNMNMMGGGGAGFMSMMGQNMMMMGGGGGGGGGQPIAAMQMPTQGAFLSQFSAGNSQESSGMEEDYDD
ncbi:hypothetical protein CcCBS67573_g09535 [Chytriomyces confervae]|uniref:Transcription initiation factor TFIID subunit 9 n=1 Tax=Chytriomyces confervae TaxID=246404 RepID=A0A507DTE3_9FUNG|nr:hypothetical protein CcCBS67573_g09535 [Chytriomyces confervae]